MTTWTIEGNLQNDEGYILTDLDEIITNESDERILFHNGDFYDSDTNWEGYEGPTTDWSEV